MMRYRLPTLLALSLLALASSSSAQQLQRDWVTLHDGGSYDHEYALDLVLDDQGNAYVTGTYELGETVDVMTMKMDRHGNVLWEQRYAGLAGGYDAGWTVRLDSEGNVIVGGDSEGEGTGFDMMVLKYDSEGAFQWVARYDGPGNGFDGMQYSPSLAIDALDRIVITGLSYGGAETGYDSACIMYAPDGTLLWERRYDGGHGLSDSSYGVLIDSEGNICLGGRSNSPTESSFMALKYSPTGELLVDSLYSFPGSSWVSIYGMTMDSDDNVLVYGITYDPGTAQDYGLVKWDNDGNFLWARSYHGGYGDDVPFHVKTDAQNRVAITGVSDGSLDADGATVMYDADGNLMWAHRYDGAPGWWGGDSPSGMIVFDKAGNACVVGWSYGGPPTAHDGHLLVYGLDGQIKAEDRFDGAPHGWDGYFGVRIADNGALMSYGTSMSDNGTMDALIVKFKANGMAGAGNMVLR